MEQKTSKKILLAITGGIAAYKMPDILSGLMKQGYETEIILTKAAKAFVSPMALSTLSGKRCWSEEDFVSQEYGWKIPHISLAEWADVIVVAPCTANGLKIAAAGDSSTLIGATLIAARKPVLLFPAMNVNMYEHETTQANIVECRKLGYTVVEPDEGKLACGTSGKGRLPEASQIYSYIERALCEKTLAGKKVLVTAGPTHEYIDPVRYLSNPSSGKMGYAIAKEAWKRGAEVTLVAGPVALTDPAGINTVHVTSAQEMYESCMVLQPECDIIIKAAAVGDFRVENIASDKVKRENKEEYSITFLQNKDIAAELGSKKKPGQILVGFAAETEKLIENAERKIKSKNLDYIAVNDVLKKDAGFVADTNSVTIISSNGSRISAEGKKSEVAGCLLDILAARKN